MKKIENLASRIKQASGLSMNIELFTEKKKLGGNGPIMANALINQGNNVTYMGSLGKYRIEPIFIEFAEKCEEVYSMARPGHTDALEFQDGKIMFGKSAHLSSVNWENLLQKITKAKLRKIIGRSDFLAFTNWTLLTELNSIIDGFHELIKEEQSPLKVFFDLADPTKRNTKDIKAVLKKIQSFNSINNVNVALGLNENESRLISRVLNLTETADLKKRAESICQSLSLEFIVIHPVKGAAVSDANNSYWVDGPYTKKPLLTTGAGDNFNAGFCNGWLNGLSLKECLVTGVATSGFYVRNAFSPNKNELIKFMKRWSDRKISE